MTRHGWGAGFLLLVAVLTGSWLLVRSSESPPDTTKAPATAASANHAPSPLKRLATVATSATPQGHRNPVATTAGTSEPSLPPADAPLEQTFDSLWTLARAGNAQAASRLYRELQRCRRTKGQRRRAWRTSRFLQQDAPSDLSPKVHESMIESMKRWLQAFRDQRARCDQLSSQDLARITPVTLRAAELGDARARRCYVHRGPTLNHAALIQHPEYLAVYKQVLPTLIKQGIQAGDWHMVDMLRYAYRPTTESWLAGAVGKDPVQYYRYLTLLSLGIREPDSRATPGLLEEAALALQPAQRAAAERWAQQTYDLYFAGNPTSPPDASWNACELPPATSRATGF